MSEERDTNPDNADSDRPGGRSVPATPGAARVPGQPATPATPAPPAGGSTFVGAAVGTRYGNVQVQITVADGRITSATVLQVPNRDRKDVMINSRAVPILNQAVVAAQSRVRSEVAVDRLSILAALADVFNSTKSAADIAKAIKLYGIDVSKANPMTV